MIPVDKTFMYIQIAPPSDKSYGGDKGNKSFRCNAVVLCMCKWLVGWLYFFARWGLAPDGLPDVDQFVHLQLQTKHSHNHTYSVS